ncbi:phenolic acid decarboxylase [Cryptococcus neoformans c45]|nr:phenolic acid decarboxylase [Cryptococcus neoformans var. grubii c45]
MPLSDIVNKHLIYTYDNGWKYEFWLKSERRIVYAIHGGPMNGRKNYQTCAVQEVRTGEIFQISWVEETSTVVSIIVDLPQKRIITYMAFSRGHWDYPEKAHGDKRNPEDFERWKKLAEVGKNTDRETLAEQATIDIITEGRGDLEDIDKDAPTI